MQTQHQVRHFDANWGGKSFEHMGLVCMRGESIIHKIVRIEYIEGTYEAIFRVAKPILIRNMSHKIISDCVYVYSVGTIKCAFLYVMDL